MSGKWVTNPGERGTIGLRYEEGSWFLSEPDTEGIVKCKIQGDEAPAPSQSPVCIDGEVSKYMYSRGDSPDFLFFVSESADIEPSPDQEPEDEAETTQTPTSHDENKYPLRRVNNLTGEGDYITVEAIVDEITVINEDDSNKPKIKGKLRDEESGLVRTFLIWSDTPHPYMKVGAKFRLTGVKDHYYEKTDQEQIVITNQTTFEVLEPAESDNSEESGEAAGSDSSREELAKYVLSNKDFNSRDGSEASSVEKAKRKARNQGRDPAIDHRIGTSQPT